jgi:hypothetical protein
MPDFLPCNEPDTNDCPIPFSLRVSGWLEDTNLGHNRAILPPAGMRMRWNCPFLGTDPKQLRLYPSRFTVFRALIREEQVLFHDSNAGHLPRIFAPKQCWRSFDDQYSPISRDSNLIYLVGPKPCDTACAVYFALKSNQAPLHAVLLDVTGRHKIEVKLNPGDRFYFEMAGLHQLVFSSTASAPNFAEPVSFLYLDRSLSSLDLKVETIAVIDAQKWLTVDFDEISQRFSNPLGQSYVSILRPDWGILRTAGRNVFRDRAAGKIPSLADLNFLELTAAHSWETATLMGWGFIDGEHPRGQTIDKIGKGMLTHSDCGIYGYQVVAEFEEDAGRSEMESTCYFASTKLMDSLSLPKVSCTSSPHARLELSKEVSPPKNPGVNQPPVVSSGRTEKFYCRVGYEMRTREVLSERLYVSPQASDANDVKFTQAGWSDAHPNDPDMRVEGLVLIQTRILDFEIPSFNSSVWLKVSVKDFWDRALDDFSTPEQEPTIDYFGTAPSLESGICHANDENLGGDTVDLVINGISGWIADLAAKTCEGQIEIWVKKEQPKSVKVDAGPAFLQPDGSWGALVSAKLSSDDQRYLTGGTFSAGAFSARIIRFTSTLSGDTICEFEASARCAGEELYLTKNGAIKAVLSENENLNCETDGTSHLWKQISSISIQSNGSPSTLTLPNVDLSSLDLKASCTLWFSTGIQLTVRQRKVYGPCCTPLAVPYLHGPPKAPELCLEVMQIGNDYYGRGIFRLTPIGCESFTPKTKIAVKGGSGRLGDQTQDDYEKDWSTQLGKGLFGPQLPSVQNDVFQAFSALPQPDGADFTLGITYVRTADNAEGPPKPVTAIIRSKPKRLPSA